MVVFEEGEIIMRIEKATKLLVLALAILTFIMLNPNGCQKVKNEYEDWKGIVNQW